MSSLTALRTLSLARNRFTGPMPMSVAKLGSFLKSLDFSGNLLGGRISVRYGSPVTTSISITMNSDKPTTTYLQFHYHCYHSHHYHRHRKHHYHHAHPAACTHMWWRRSRRWAVLAG